MAAQPLWPDEPVDAIMRVMERAFDPRYGEAWSRRQVSDALVLGTSRHALIAPDGTIREDSLGETAGFFLSRQTLDEEELLLFAIDPAWRQRGLGATLLEYFCTSAAARGMAGIFLEMRDGNPAARLYEGHGFKQVGKRPAYYRGTDGARLDALTYQRILA
ncbi:MAG: GNAT family N-acetyltransferase [Novosphingobium sp.]|nr:GNAT family N-acetyltransferase [Novosphingobium sp.]